MRAGALSRKGPTSVRVQEEVPPFAANSRRRWAQDTCATAAASRGTQMTESRSRGQARRAGYLLRCLYTLRMPSH